MEVHRRARDLLSDTYRSVLAVKYSARGLALACVNVALRVVAKKKGNSCIAELGDLDMSRLDSKVVGGSAKYQTEAFTTDAIKKITDEVIVFFKRVATLKRSVSRPDS